MTYASPNKCPNCGSPREHGLILCPTCRISTGEFDQAKTEAQRKAERDLRALIWKQLWAPFLGVIAILTAVTGVGYWQIYAALRNQVLNSIATKFDEPKIQATLQDVAGTPASELMERNLAPEISRTKTHLNKELDAFRAANEFGLTVLKARADDRQAFDRLEQLANDKGSQFSAPAFDTWVAILDENDGPYGAGLALGLSPGVDARQLPMSEFRRLYLLAPKYQRAAIIEAVSNRKDMPRRDRVQFLAEVLESDSSLRAVRYAGIYFNREAGLKYKPLAVRPMLAWWSANRDQIK